MTLPSILLLPALLAAPAPVSTVRVTLEEPAIRRAAIEGDRILVPPATEVQILRDREGRVLGLGRITIRGVVVRRGETPITIRVEGREGQAEPASVELARANAGPRTGRVVLQTRLRFPDGSIDRLDWHLRGETWRIDGQAAHGFTYWLEYRSETRRVHRLVEGSSWCLGGDVAGRLYIEQSEGYGRGSRAVVFRPDTALRPPSPLLPQKETPESRQAVGDYVDFLTAANASLARFVAEPALTFRSITRRPGEQELQAREEYVTPLALQFRTPPMTVLLHPAGGVNAWFVVRDAVAERLRAKAGIHPQPPMPWVAIPSFDVASWAPNVDERLDFYARMGFKRLWKWSLWQTAWSEWQTLSEAERKLAEKAISHSVLRLEWASKLTVEQIRALCRGAEERGMSVALWFPTAHLSPASPLLKEHPEWVVRRRNGAPFEYVYPEIVGVYHPAGYSAYALERLRALKRQAGFGGLFFDSAQVFGFDAIQYGHPDWPDQFGAMLDFIRRLNAEGLPVLVECLSPYAIPASTGFFQQPGSDPEFLAYRTNPHWGSPEAPITPERYFRLVAFMAPPLLVEDVWWKDARLQELGAYVNRAYNRRLPHMERCLLLPDGQGTLWWGEKRQQGTLFAFRSGWVSLGRAPRRVAEVLSGTTAQTSGDRVLVDAYRIGHKLSLPCGR